MVNDSSPSPAKPRPSIKKKKTAGKKGVGGEAAAGFKGNAVEFYMSWSPEFKEFIRYLCFVALFCAVIFMPRNADPFFMTKVRAERGRGEKGRRKTDGEGSSLLEACC